jgi:hypothetical protein
MSNNNIFGKDGFYWWFGVVEDRMDPLLLGRCRVRIIGYHTDDQKILPTDELPWAIPMQGITSAAISGKGDTPLGPLEGTWVLGFFADGKDCQQPMIMGTLGGIPQTSAGSNIADTATSNALRDSAGNVVRDQNGNAIAAEPVPVNPGGTASKAISRTMPPLQQNDLQTVMDQIGFKESGSTSNGVQVYNTQPAGTEFSGKYQFAPTDLLNTGLVRAPVGGGTRSFEEITSNPNIWTGRNGCESYADWLANKNNCQELAMYENMYNNYQELKTRNVITTETDRATVAGYLSAAHLNGASVAADLKSGNDQPDNYGVRPSEYFAIGAQALGGSVDANKLGLTGAAVTGLKNFAGILNNPKLGFPAGFTDPNSVFPTSIYANRQDTNKLATNNSDMNKTILKPKESTRIETIPMANGRGKWEEPTPAFQGRYPYNKVKETESGHIIELDDTPGAERIHLYHRTGTHVEIDKNGSVRTKVKGENYEIYTRNNNVYVQGNSNVTVDGAKTLFVKGALDVEVLGKTTVNIKNDADVNISGNLNLKAKNINMEAAIDFNITAGNYMNVKTGGDLNYIIAGDEQHRISGTYDLDAIVVSMNSGTSVPFGALASGLPSLNSIPKTTGLFDSIAKNAFPAKLVNNLNPISKGLSGLIGGITGGGFLNRINLGSVFSGLPSAGALNSLGGGAALLGGAGGLSSLVSGGAGNLLGGAGLSSLVSGGAGNLLNTAGLTGFNNILNQAGVGNLNSVLSKAGLNLGNVNSILATGGLSNLNNIISGAGLGNLDTVIKNAGVNLQSLAGNVLPQSASSIFSTLTRTGILPVVALTQGTALVNSFFKNGASQFDFSLPKVIANQAVATNEFKDWAFIPAAAQLSKNFDIGSLSNRVAEVSMQFPLMNQAGLTKGEIAGNLKNLAVNTLDPIANKFSNAQVTDAFRPMNSYLAAVQVNNPVKDLMKAASGAVAGNTAVEQLLNTPTQHNLGQAANLSFKGMAPAEYYNTAGWIKNNVAFDQLRLEYSTLGSAEPFITVTNNPAGNRPANAPDKIVTAVNGQVVANYLVDMTSVS